MIGAKTKIEIEGITYSVGRLPAPVALKLMLKIAPLMKGMSGINPDVITGKGDNVDPSEKHAMIEQAIGSLLSGIGELQEDTVDWILDKTLRIVERELGSGRGYGPVWVNGALMYEDMTLATMLKLVGKVLMDNLAGFTPALFPQTATAGAALSK